jgi:hypothetical protein
MLISIDFFIRYACIGQLFLLAILLRRLFAKKTYCLPPISGTIAA